MIPGTIPFLGGGAGKRADFVAVRSDGTNTGSFFFSNVPFGVFDPTRIIVIAIHWYEFDTSASITSLTVGGLSTTTRVSTSRLVAGGSGSYVYCSMNTVKPTGTTGNVSLSFNRAINYGCVVGLWALYNVGSVVPVDTSIADGDGTFSLSAQPSDLVVAAATGVYDGSSTSWTNASENYDSITVRMLSSGAQREMLTTGDPGINFSMPVVSGVPVGVAGVWR